MAQLHLGPTHVRIRPLNSSKLVAVMSSLGKLFHTRADSNLNDLCPYVTVLTVGILTVFAQLIQNKSLHIALFEHFKQSANKLSQMCQSKSYIAPPRFNKKEDGRRFVQLYCCTCMHVLILPNKHQSIIYYWH